MPRPFQLLARLQQLVVQYCIVVLYLFIGVEIIELSYVLVRSVLSPEAHGGRLLISARELGNLVPVFLSVLISLELVETLRVYRDQHVVRIQMILLVGLTAITRHLLTADVFHGEPLLNFSLAALLLALAGSYFLIDASEKSKAP